MATGKKGVIGIAAGPTGEALSITELEQKVSDLSRQLKIAQSKVNVAEEERTFFEEQIGRGDGQVESVLERLRREREVSMDLREEIIRLEERLSQAQQPVPAAPVSDTEGNAVAIVQAQKLAEDAQRAQQMVQGELNATKEKLAEAERRLNAARQEADAARKEADTAVKRAKAASGGSDKIRAVEQERDAAKVEIAQLKAQVASTQAEINAREEETKEALLTLEAKLNATRTELQKARTAIDEGTYARTDVDSARQEADGRIAKMQADTEAFRQKLIREVEVVKGEAGKQLADAEHRGKQALEQLRRELDAKVDAERRKGGDRAQETIRTLEGQLANARTQRDRASAEIDRARRELAAAHDVNERFRREVEDIRAEADDDRTVAQRLQVAIESQNDLLEAIEEEQIARIAAEAELNELRKKVSTGGGPSKAEEELRSNYEMVQAMLKNSQSIMEEREKELLNALKQIGRLRREVQTLRAQQTGGGTGELTADSLTAIGSPSPQAPQPDWNSFGGPPQQQQQSGLRPGNEIFTARLDDIENDDDTFVRRLKDIFGNR